MIIFKKNLNINNKKNIKFINEFIFELTSILI